MIHLFYFTNSSSTFFRQEAAKSIKISTSGETIDTYVIGVGDKYSKELQNIAGSRGVYSVDNFAALEDIVADLIVDSCS